MKKFISLILVVLAFSVNAQIRISDLNLKSSIEGTEKIPVGGPGNPAINSNLLKAFIEKNVPVIIGTNSKTGTIVQAPTAYTQGMRVTVINETANTAGVDVNFNSLGAKNVLKNGNQALDAGDMKAGAPYVLVYDGTQFQLIGGGSGFETQTLKGDVDITTTDNYGIRIRSNFNETSPITYYDFVTGSNINTGMGNGTTSSNQFMNYTTWRSTVTSSLGNKRLSMITGTPGIVVTDEISDMGLVGAADFSSAYTSLSYVQKDYVDKRPEQFGLACSDLTTTLTTGTTKAYFRVPKSFTITAVRASVLTAQTAGSILTIDINESGTTILSTKLTIDNSEKTSTTAATAAVISDTSLADDAEITIDIDQVGTSPVGLIVWIIGY